MRRDFWQGFSTFAALLWLLGEPKDPYTLAFSLASGFWWLAWADDIRSWKWRRLKHAEKE